MNDKRTDSTTSTDVKRQLLEQSLESANATWASLNATRIMLDGKTDCLIAQNVYRKSVAEHSIRITDLSIMFGCTIAASSDCKPGHLPSAERINIKQTLTNYDCHR